MLLQGPLSCVACLCTLFRSIPNAGQVVLPRPLAVSYSLHKGPSSKSFSTQVSNLAGFQEPGVLASPVLPFPLGEAAPALPQFPECVIGGTWGGECSGSEGSTGPTHIRMGKCHTTVSRHGLGWARQSRKPIYILDHISHLLKIENRAPLHTDSLPLAVQLPCSS